ncbi:MAG: DUF1461 domain-containing protein [Coriobacteriia bacterium]|nr:DUF1461 domain-containing protein [Coriobacteriia bacterium]
MAQATFADGPIAKSIAIACAVMLFVLVIVVSIYLTSSPPIVSSLIHATHNASVLSSELRERGADTSTRFIRNGTGEVEMIEFFESDKIAGEASIEHLRDVRTVILFTWIVGAICAILIITLLITSYFKKWWSWLRTTLKFAAWICLAVPLLLGFIVGVAFDPLFTFFHEIFFPQGNWQFPIDSLLIQTFPEQFWVTIMLILLGLIFAFGVLFLLADRLIDRFAPHQFSVVE